MILILGGTAEARELAATLLDAGVAVTTSLAGAVANPRLPAGAVRSGGFGGVEGLTGWLHEHRVSAVIDATHPFAERISANAASAAPAAGVPLLRLERPPYAEQPGDRWIRVPDLGGAARELDRAGVDSAFITTGRQGLHHFASARAHCLIRTVDRPDGPLPARHALILDRGPFTLAGELELIDRHAVELLISKDSGGGLTEAKLEAARARELPVVMVSRPPRPAGESVGTVAEAVAWLRARHSAG